MSLNHHHSFLQKFSTILGNKNNIAFLQHENGGGGLFRSSPENNKNNVLNIPTSFAENNKICNNKICNNKNNKNFSIPICQQQQKQTKLSAAAKTAEREEEEHCLAAILKTTNSTKTPTAIKQQIVTKNVHKKVQEDEEKKKKEEKEKEKIICFYNCRLFQNGQFVVVVDNDSAVVGKMESANETTKKFERSEKVLQSNGKEEKIGMDEWQQQQKQKEQKHHKQQKEEEEQERFFSSSSSSFCSSFSPSTPQLWVRDGKVLDERKVFFHERRRPSIFVDCQGLVLAPGFVDVQVNGAFGVDFTQIAAKTGCEKKAMEEARRQLLTVARKLLQHGVTAFCPTLITAPPEVYRNFLELLKNMPMDDCAAHIIGAHFEGPFISGERSGCHPKESIQQFSTNNCSIDAFYGIVQKTKELSSPPPPSTFFLPPFFSSSRLAIVTLAPEMEGATEAIKTLSALGVRVSIGHSNASLEQAQNALSSGASAITHLFCAMTPFHHRSPGIAGLLTAGNVKHLKKQQNSPPSPLPHSSNCSPLYYGIIADGVHVSEAAIQLAYSANPDGAMLVTDATSATGLGDGNYSLGSRTIKVEGRKATVEGTNTLAGSVSLMVDCIKFFASCLEREHEKNDECVAKALRAATFVPANFVGIQHQKGTLLPGSDADFVLFDERRMEVVATFVGGVKCFEVEEGKGEEENK